MMVLRSQRRLIALFLAAVLLPCALLVLLTVRGMRQERELAEKRAVDERARVFVQVQQALLCTTGKHYVAGVERACRAHLYRP